jgi:hypothetical protein
VYAPSVPTAAIDTVTHASATASARPIVTTARTFRRVCGRVFRVVVIVLGRGRTFDRVLRVVVIVLAFPVSPATITPVRGREASRRCFDGILRVDARGNVGVRRGATRSVPGVVLPVGRLCSSRAK